MESSKAEPGKTNDVPDEHCHWYVLRFKNILEFRICLRCLEQKTAITDLRDNDKVLTEAELRAAVDLLFASASATGTLTLDDYNQDETDSDYFKLRQDRTLKFRTLCKSEFFKCKV